MSKFSDSISSGKSKVKINDSAQIIELPPIDN